MIQKLLHRVLAFWLCACAALLPAAALAETTVYYQDVHSSMGGGLQSLALRFGGELFARPAGEYDPDLAWASILACTVANTGSRSIVDNDVLSPESRTSVNALHITRMLDMLGFQNIEAHHYDDLSRKPTDRDTNGYTFGHQTLADASGGTFTLIAVIARGTALNEWYSNFNVGRGMTLHQGFDAAGREMLDALSAYAERYGLDKTTDTNRVWLTGHSRGAAVVNAAAARLLQDQSLAVRGRIYAYTFATPNVINVRTEDTRQGAHEASTLERPQPDGTIYEGIINIVNRDDFITYISPWANDADGDLTLDLYQDADTLAALQSGDDAAAYQAIRQGKYGVTVAFSPRGSDRLSARIAELIKQKHGVEYKGYSAGQIMTLLDAFIGFSGSPDLGYEPVTLSNGETITPYDLFTALFEGIMNDRALSAVVDMTRSILLLPQEEGKAGNHQDAATIARLLIYSGSFSGEIVNAHMPDTYIAAVQAYNEALGW